jgi:cytochrome c oxidase cbb3-type subunit 3
MKTLDAPQSEPLLPGSHDGIREFDNRLPAWWLATLYLTVIFAVVYWMWYHTMGAGDLPGEIYQREMAGHLARMQAAALQVNAESLVALSRDPTAVESGRQVYAQNCVACHRYDGGGGIGPNLTDERWIHGGTPEVIHRTVAEGVPAKGMLAWMPMLGPQRVGQVVAFVLALRNTNVPGGKEPQGDPAVP